MGSMVLFIGSTIFTDFIIPTWEADYLVQTAASMSFFNLMFRSTIIIIYSGDRCDGESKVLTYFKSEEDMLWVWFKHSIYQLIFFRILGYIALYIQANFEKFNFNKFFNSKKNSNINLQLNQHNKKVSFGKVNYDNKAYIANDNDENNETNIKIENQISKKNSGDQKRYFQIEINDETFKTFAIAWKNLSYSKETFFETFLNRKIILSNLKGKIDFGTITALMGPSGAGKTTLLKCIYGIKRAGLSSDTEFYVNKFTKIKPVFIVQEHKQHLLMNLTVRESLKYSSLLKNNKSSRRKQKTNDTSSEVHSIDKLIRIVLDEIEFDHNANINRILSELMLTNCADNKVSQCSGGEQKRLSIGLELTPKVKPNLMCIDEPTSGLDSYTAEQVSLEYFSFNT